MRKKPERRRNNDFGNNQPLKLFLELFPPAPKIFRALGKKKTIKGRHTSSSARRKQSVLQSLVLSQHQQPESLAQFCPLIRSGLISPSSALLQHSELAERCHASAGDSQGCAVQRGEDRQALSALLFKACDYLTPKMTA